MENESKLAPIALFVYSRANHTKATVEALAKNDFAKYTHLWIFSDGPIREESMVKVEEVRDYIESIPSQNWFESVTIVKSIKNKGLANSIIYGVSKLTKKYGRVIVVEDDLVTTPDYLEFMNSALDFYKTNYRVGSVTGYSPIYTFPSDYKYDVYVANRNCSYGWGTWSDRWERVDWQAKAYKNLRTSFKLRNQFNECGIDRYNRLERQMKGEIDSWSIRFGLFQFMNGLYTVYPVVSRLRNIGWDGSGTHNTDKSSSLSMPYNQKIVDKKTPFQLENVEADSRIVQSVKNIYSGNLTTKIARTIKNYCLVTASLFK